MSTGEGDQLTVHVRIEGRVQAVGFRYWTRLEAERLGLDGWVRNRRDRSVEAAFSGAERSVREMLRLCGDGPPGARVDRLKIMQEGGGVPPGFEIRPTT